MKLTKDVSRETQDRLETYIDLLTRWNKRIRLTGLDVTSSASTPITDSLDLASLLASHPLSALDIGSGNGLPAVPLSIAFHIPYVLVEADRRKAAFLSEVVRETGCPVSVAACRIEELAAEPFNLITARAFGSLSRLLDLAYPRQMNDTMCLFPKGESLTTEWEEAERRWSFTGVRHVARSGQVAEIRSITPRL